LIGVSLKKAEVRCQGISQLTVADIDRARAEAKRWKLIGRIKKEPNGLTASVGPEMVPITDPLAHVMDATNAITYETDLLGPVTLIGAGAGSIETGFALLADLINIARRNL
jgi:homoserine dehydrogenase